MALNVIQGSFPRGLPRFPRAADASRVNAVPLPPHLATFPRGGGQPLPAAFRQAAEGAFGVRFGDVRVHVGPHVAAIGADAFTHGSTLHFATGRYQPETSAGQRLLLHELAHVVQQRSGRVRSPFPSGIAIVGDALLEAEADRIAQRAATAMPRPQLRAPLARTASRGSVRQGLWMYTYPAGNLVEADYSVEDMQRFGKVSFSHRGFTVWCAAENVEAARAKVENKFQSGSLIAVPSADDLDEPDAPSANCVQGATILTRKGWNFGAIARGSEIFIYGNVFYRLGQGEIHFLTAAMVHRFFDGRYPGFTKIGPPDWRYVCSDYAISDDRVSDADPIETTLQSNFTEVLDFTGRNSDDAKAILETTQGHYVCRLGYHYVRLMADNLGVTVSQKDGESAVYSKRMSFDEAAKYIFAKAPSVRKLYRRK